MALTDQELLLLDNFMYMKASVSPDREFSTLGELTKYYLDNPDLIAQTEDEKKIVDYKYILEEIQKNDKLKKLGLGEATSMETDAKVRGRCFIEYDEAGNVAGHIVAFRGTGGSYVAWKDNFDGAYQAETECQSIARSFVKNLPYNDITITGHSKGGNMAMYCTARLGDKIERCVSFDGQGFGEAFYASITKEELEAASAKTTSIGAHNDYVNPILKPFAGRNICVANPEEGYIEAHSSCTLYMSNVAALEQEQNGGYFTEDMEVDRDLWIEWADFGIETILRFLPEDEKALLADLVGSYVAHEMDESSQNVPIEDKWKEDFAV